MTVLKHFVMKLIDNVGKIKDYVALHSISAKSRKARSGAKHPAQCAIIRIGIVKTHNARST